MISIAYRSTATVRENCPVNGLPKLIDGAEIINALCPVSKKTGLRENPLTLIRKLINDPAKQALLQQCLVEMPVDNSQTQLTDEQRFEFCRQRLDLGTPAEEDLYRGFLESIFDNVDAQAQAAIKPQIDGQIDFKPSDAPEVEA